MAGFEHMLSNLAVRMTSDVRGVAELKRERTASWDEADFLFETHLRLTSFGKNGRWREHAASQPAGCG